MYSCLETGWLNLPHSPLYSTCSFKDNPRCKHSLWATAFLLQRAIFFTPIAYELHVVWNRCLWVYLNRVSRCEVNPSTVGRIWLHLYQILLLHLDLLSCARLLRCKSPRCIPWSRRSEGLCLRVGRLFTRDCSGNKRPPADHRNLGVSPHTVYLHTSTQACRTMMLVETRMACQWKNACWDASRQHPH